MAKMIINTTMIANKMIPRAIGIDFSYIGGYFLVVKVFLPGMYSIIAYCCPSVNIDLLRFR